MRAAQASSGGTPGNDKATWAELTPHEMQAATTLGMNAISWLFGMAPNAANRTW